MKKTWISVMCIGISIMLGGCSVVKHDLARTGEELVRRLAEASNQNVPGDAGNNMKTEGDALCEPVFAEDMYVLRKAQAGIGALRRVKIMVAGGDEHLAAAAVERVRERARRLAEGAVGIEQIAGQEDNLGAVLPRQLRQRAEQVALLLPPPGGLLAGQGLEGRIEMQIRRVEHSDAHRMRSASALRQSPVSQSMVKIAPSSLQRPAAAS